MIPDDLTELDQWVCWRYQNATKIPYQISGIPAKSNDPLTWTTYADASAHAQEFSGVGFVFSQADPFVGIDLDDCLDNGQLKPWARPIIERFADTYAEISPSGNGIKLWARGTVPVDCGGVPVDKNGNITDHAKKDGSIEWYSRGRYFTVTGNVFRDGPCEINDEQSSLDWLVSTYAQAPAPEPVRTGSSGARFDVQAFIARHGIATLPPESFSDARGSGQRWRITGGCPFQPDYAGGSPSITQWASGAMAFDCFCGDHGAKTWRDLRDMYEPRRVRSIAERRQPVITGAAVPAPESNWESRLIWNVDRKGTPTSPKAILANCIIALKYAPEWSDVLAFNEFAVQVENLLPTPWDKPAGPWTDDADRRTAEWLQHHGILASTQLAGEAVQSVAQMRLFHPVQDYLRSLRWDGEKRIGTWVNTYLGADPAKEIVRVFGHLWLISAVARGLRPGCKADCCLVLEGLQGRRKSTAVRTLAGDAWFTDQLAELGSKDAAMQCSGVWIVEIAELDSINRSEVNRIKAFMSSMVDRIRLPYGRTVGTWPRGCVFVATGNRDAYLRDETGNRRFWPIHCGDIDIDALARDRDQLWAEAVVEFQDGARWWLEGADQIRAAEDEQLERYEGGQWDSMIYSWLHDPRERNDEHGNPVGELQYDGKTEISVSVDEILLHCVGKDPGHWTRNDQMAVSSALKSMRWERFQHRGKNAGKKREWRYRKSS